MQCGVCYFAVTFFSNLTTLLYHFPEGKDGQIELFNFREAIIAIDEENRQCGQDLKEIWQELLGGVGRK